MENEIISLENSPKIGVIECLSEGITKFFTNFGSFCKMLLPVAYLCLATLLLILTTFCASLLIGAAALGGPFLILFIIFAIAVGLIGILVFGWAFWEYLIGFIAVSYLAKDIYENKPVQKSSDYYSYAKKYSKEYMNYWLVNILISLVWLLILVLINAAAIYGIGKHFNICITIFYICLGVLYTIFTIPLLFGLSMSKFFFAYQDKEKPYQIIKTAISATYKNFLPVLGFLFLLHVVIFAIEITLGFLLMPLSPFFSIIAAYFTVFVTTRYYFDLIKN